MATAFSSRQPWGIVRHFALGLLLVAGCDGSGDSATISSQTLSGKIGGKAWTFTQGETDPIMSDSSSFWVTLYASTFSACATFMPPEDAGTVLLDLPKTAGGFDLSMSKTATFFIPPETNLAALQGHIQIDTVTSTTITGGAKITYNGDNTVDGQFQVTICP
jgi:hypothetical protein